MFGPPNPKTLIPPIIVPPPFAYDAWRNSSSSSDSRINAASQIFYSQQAGYDTLPQRAPLIIPEPIIPISNINPFFVNYLGPNTYMVSLPATVNSNIGISTTRPTGLISRHGQMMVESFEPIAPSLFPEPIIGRPEYASRTTANLPSFDFMSTADAKLLADADYSICRGLHIDDMQASLMRKKHSEAWQTKVAPLGNRFGQIMGGSRRI